MPGNLKNLVRARMAKTGESYQQALRQIRTQGQGSTSNEVGDPVLNGHAATDDGISTSDTNEGLGTKLLYLGDALDNDAQRQVSTVVWGSLRDQDYAEGTEVRVFVERRETTYYVEARAREPGGPILRLADLEVPIGGAPSDEFESLLESNGLFPPQPSDVPVVGIDFSAPRKVGRNERCPCGSGRKYKQCCLKGSTRS